MTAYPSQTLTRTTLSWSRRRPRRVAVTTCCRAGGQTIWKRRWMRGYQPWDEAETEWRKQWWRTRRDLSTAKIDQFCPPKTPLLTFEIIKHRILPCLSPSNKKCLYWRRIVIGIERKWNPPMPDELLLCWTLEWSTCWGTAEIAIPCFPVAC